MGPVLIGLDAGTSLIKAVAFDDRGHQLALAAVPNGVDVPEAGRAEQDMLATWERAARALRELLSAHPEYVDDVEALAVTGQGDGTWLVGKDGTPVRPACIWLDGRAGAIARDLDASEHGDRLRAITASGINPSLQSCQLMWFAKYEPDVLRRTDKALHCKDWLFYCLSGLLRTGMAEACYTFGSFRSGEYDNRILEIAGLQQYKRLLPPMVQPLDCKAKLTAEAARLTGLKSGTPVILAPVDMVSATLGAGVYQPGRAVGCSVLGTAGVHARVVPTSDVPLDPWQGYTMPFPVPGTRLRVMTHMAATLNIEWVANLVSGLLARVGGQQPEHEKLYKVFDEMVAESEPATVLYSPFIYANGERAPFLDPAARAQFVGLETGVDFSQLVRAVYESLALAACDCFDAMGGRPDELRVGGGAIRSSVFRKILASALGVPLRSMSSEESGAAGAAMLAAVAFRHYSSLEDACRVWVEPRLGEVTSSDPDLQRIYANILPLYRESYRGMRSNWTALAEARRINQRIWGNRRGHDEANDAEGEPDGTVTKKA